MSLPVTQNAPRPIVVIATKGRPDTVAAVIKKLGRQTFPPVAILIVGTCEADLPNKNDRIEADLKVEIISPRIGLSSQRNIGVEYAESVHDLSGDGYFLAFFDDDFVPADNWLEMAALAFKTDLALAGLTGHVLADGINGAEIGLNDAERYLSGALQPLAHWSAVQRPKRVESLYGCNMAFRSAVVTACRFDEALPLYSWQEDCDYSGQARRFGKTMIVPDCKGVHLGVKSARIGGVRMGYSQIANPIRIASRRNMSPLRAARFVLKALAANLIRSAQGRQNPDYVGRLKGNGLALTDMIRLRLDTRRILEL